MLVSEALVSHEEVDDALEVQKEQGGHLLENLICLGYFDTHDYDQLILRQPDIARFDLKQCEVFEDTVELVPGQLAEKYRVFPIDKLGPLLTLGMAVPVDEEAIDKVAKETGLRVKPVYCFPSDINAAIERHYNGQADEGTTVASSNGSV